MRDAFGHPQSVVVLGGTSEIAGAIVRGLIGQRARTVVLAGRDPALLERAADEARSAGATTVGTVTFEATDQASAEPAVTACFEKAGGQVDLVLVTVGLLGDQLRDEVDPAKVAEMVTVNFTWPAEAVTSAMVRLRAQGSGRVVVLSSVAGVRVRRANFLYGSAKAGLDAFALGQAEAARAEGADLKVQVVRPGFVHTKMTKGRPAAPFSTSPEAVSAAVLRGIETDAPVIWAPAPLRWAFGVFRLLPQAVWRRLPG